MRRLRSADVLALAAIAVYVTVSVAISTASAAGARTLSDEGFRFLRNHEGFRGRLYNDSPHGGHCTIGYGHLVHLGPCNGTEPATFRNGITREQADALLRSDVERAVRAVNERVAVPLEQPQFDALVSFAYNVGAPAFAGSTLVRVLNAGKLEQAPVQMRRWVHSNGRRLPGLVNRRNAEVELFRSRGAPAGGGGCRRLEVEFGQRVIRKADGTFVLGQHILRACWPRAVTLTVINETPQILLVQGSGDGPGNVPQHLSCGGPVPRGARGDACSIRLQVFDPPWADPRVNLSYAFNVPRVVMRGIVTPPPGERARGYEVEWQTVKGGIQPCGGNVYSAFCEVLLGENGDVSDPSAPRLARPRSVTLRVRATIE